ncbi:hypothetical protein FA13DRAFT_1712450 [Coprinellus micaceus]|uniref:Uncharacterized protein n=1 Tax=Coprinellus micaceus TaxID=71717 RepID=A0A4Y7T058_COPMI|nr:hypothetical protein FA13DRAFT_1712450 [Coprinellus micaceus]
MITTWSEARASCLGVLGEGFQSKDSVDRGLFGLRPQAVFVPQASACGTYQGDIRDPDLFEKVDFPNLPTLRLAALQMEDLFSEKLKAFRNLESRGAAASVRIHPYRTHPRPVHRLRHVWHGPQDPEGKKDLLPLLHTLVLGYPTGEGHEPSPDRIPPRALDLQSLLKARAAGVHPTSHIRKIIVWGDVSSEIGDGQDFVKVIRQFVECGEMVFERRFGRLEEMKVEMWTLGRVGGRKLEPQVFEPKRCFVLHSALVPGVRLVCLAVLWASGASEVRTPRTYWACYARYLDRVVAVAHAAPSLFVPARPVENELVLSHGGLKFARKCLTGGWKPQQLAHQISFQCEGGLWAPRLHFLPEKLGMRQAIALKLVVEERAESRKGGKFREMFVMTNGITSRRPDSLASPARGSEQRRASPRIASRKPERFGSSAA